MTTDRLPRAILRAASLLAPAGQRAGWLDEWRSELWYIPRSDAIRFSLGAFPDALWLRRNSPPAPPSNLVHPVSPVACLALVAAVAVAMSLLAIHLPCSPGRAWPSRLSLAEVLWGSVGMLIISAVLLPATRLVLGPAASPGQTLRRALFFAAKVILVQPTLFCLMFLQLSVHAQPLAVAGIWLAFALIPRWVIVDQRRRCPVCLRVLTDPVRIGAPSQTLLEWYGGESACALGHGLLQVPEFTASYAGDRQWLSLDESWSSLFLDHAGRRP